MKEKTDMSIGNRVVIRMLRLCKNFNSLFLFGIPMTYFQLMIFFKVASKVNCWTVLSQWMQLSNFKYKGRLLLGGVDRIRSIQSGVLVINL